MSSIAHTRPVGRVHRGTLTKLVPAPFLPATSVRAPFASIASPSLCGGFPPAVGMAVSVVGVIPPAGTAGRSERRSEGRSGPPLCCEARSSSGFRNSTSARSGRPEALGQPRGQPADPPCAETRPVPRWTERRHRRERGCGALAPLLTKRNGFRVPCGTVRPSVDLLRRITTDSTWPSRATSEPWQGRAPTSSWRPNA